MKTLEQKLLQADDSDFDGMEDEEIDGPAQVEVFKLELPEEKHNADLQLQFSSEMISIDEFESRIEDEPKKFYNAPKAISSMGYTEVEHITDYVGMNVTSEVDHVETTSPIL